MGAAAAVVAEWPPERDASGSGNPAGSSTLEGTASETTSKAEMTEGTASETTDDASKADPGEVPSDETTFVHTATEGNSRGDYTYISDPSIDGDPDAVVLVTRTPDRGSAGARTASASAAASYGHNIGVWYDFVDEKKWAIFNQDRAAVPAGSIFEVVVPPASESFVHRAGFENTAGDTTYLDNALTNGRPGAAVSVTQNWNPGGGVGVYNDHPVGVFYDEDAEQWAGYNLDGAPMPEGAAFNIAVSEGAEGER